MYNSNTYSSSTQCCEDDYAEMVMLLLQSREHTELWSRQLEKELCASLHTPVFEDSIAAIF